MRAKNSKPVIKPQRPYFSCGPCVKPPNWTLDQLADALVNRSHRSQAASKKLTEAIQLTRQLLQLPDQHQIVITPASDTGAVEMALWSLLGQRPVTVMSWDHFGREWVTDIIDQLKLPLVNVLAAEDGQLPDFSKVEPTHDLVFTWNGTSAGACVPHLDFISPERTGLTICDATSAAFARHLDFTKLDVVTFSWQKVMGGEAAHGMLILGPRALERLKSYTPPWPLPKIFRLVDRHGELLQHYFEGQPINTPSMLCVEDYLHNLRWALRLGGLETLIERCCTNAAAVWQFISESPWLDHLVEEPAARSNTAVCMRIVDSFFLQLSLPQQERFVDNMLARLEQESVAFDIRSYKTAPLGLRIWTGATVELADLEALFPWLRWAFYEEKANWEARSAENSA